MSFPSFITRKPVKFYLEFFWRFTPCMPMERGLSVMGDYQCSYTSALSHVGSWDLLGLRSGGTVLCNHLSGRLKTKRRLSKHVYAIRHINVLTAHNWQKLKRVFLTCPCHKIYRDEAVGLKSHLLHDLGSSRNVRKPTLHKFLTLYALSRCSKIVNMRCKEVRFQNPYIEKKMKCKEVRFQNPYIEKHEM